MRLNTTSQCGRKLILKYNILSLCKFSALNYIFIQFYEISKPLLKNGFRELHSSLQVEAVGGKVGILY